MRFGPHTGLVDEVIEYARTGPLFGGYRDEHGGSIVETNFARAVELSRIQYLDPPYAVWADLGAQAMSQVRGAKYGLGWFKPVEHELLVLSDELMDIFYRRLAGSLLTEVSDEIASDFAHLAYKRAVLGPGEHFFESLFDCYKAGGWPCGWKGEHPMGQMIVYSSRQASPI